tara:strand:- start:20332 stop:20868 length:537 start_codon:yes stop_codon:yes gene_type:complete
MFKDLGKRNAPTKKRVDKYLGLSIDDPNRVITAHTDGSCRDNPGAGGWGAVLQLPDGRGKKIKGGHPATTNNRMELQAAIEVFKLLQGRGSCKVILFTDSQYVQKGMLEWVRGWKMRGWKTSGGAPVKNSDLWIELEFLSSTHIVEWNWVRGHNGDYFNEMADRLAEEGAIEAGYYKD